MNRLIAALVILAALYGGYWFVGAATVEKQGTAALEGLSSDGWDVTYGALDTVGFPNRFDTTLSDFSLTEPSTGVTWAAPFVQVLALSYRPDRAIIAFAPSQTVVLPWGEAVTVSTDGLLASLEYRIGGDFGLEHLTAESGPISLLSDRGWRVTAERALAAQREAGAADSFDLWFDSEGIALPATLLADLDPAKALPDTIGLLRFDSQVTMADGGIGTLTIRDWSAVWGDMGLKISGELSADSFDFAAGQVTVSADNWPLLLQVLTRAGIVPEQAVTPLNGSLSAASGGQPSVQIPLTLRDGTIFVGFFPLGPAPRLR